MGELLRDSGVPTVELRAAAIIGAGSASFEMLRYRTERLPVMVTPRWLRTCVQPIAVRDVLHYLVRAADLPAEVDRPLDTGGPDHFTYSEMIRKYAAVAGLARRLAVPVPVLTPGLSSGWVGLVTPLPRQLAASLMESLENHVVCADHDIERHIPDPDGGLTHHEASVELALAHVRESDLRTKWSQAATDGEPSRPLPTDPRWAGGSLYDEVRQYRCDADAATMWRAIQTAATENDWSATPLGWPLRGWVDWLRGAVRPRRRPLGAHRLHDGEALHWWRVERIDARSCCGSVPTFHCRDARGWNAPRAPTALAARCTGSGRCFSRMGLPDSFSGSPRRRLATWCWAVSGATSRPRPATA